MPKQTARPGDAFAFDIGDGRFGACRVLAYNVEDDAALVECSAWIGASPDEATEADVRRPLLLTHHAHRGRPVRIWVWGRPPKTLIPLPPVEPTAEDAEVECNSFAYWEAVTCQPLLQWRWDHDREAQLADDVAAEAARVRKMEAAARRRQRYLATVTPEKVAESRLLADWPRVFDAKAVRATRVAVREAARDLAALPAEGRGRKAAARLRRLMRTLNDVDRDHGHFIDTEARDDLIGLLEDLCHAAGIPRSLDRLIDLREW